MSSKIKLKNKFVKLGFLFTVLGIAFSCSKRKNFEKGHFSSFSTPHRSVASFNPVLLEKIQRFKNFSDPRQIYLTCYNKNNLNIESCFNKNLNQNLSEFHSQIKDLDKTQLKNFKDNFSYKMVEAEIKYINQKIIVSLSDAINKKIQKEFSTCAKLLNNADFKNCFFKNDLLNGANFIHQYQKKNPSLNPIEYVYMVKFVQTIVANEKKNHYDKKIDYSIGILEEELRRSKKKIIRKIASKIDPAQQSQLSDLILMCHEEIDQGLQEVFERNPDIKIIADKKVRREYNQSICFQLNSNKKISKKLSHIFNESYKKLLSIYQLTLEKNYLVKSNCSTYKNSKKETTQCLESHWDKLSEESLREILDQEKTTLTRDYSDFLHESIQKKQKSIFKSIYKKL